MFKLAYAEPNTQVERLLAPFNKEQMHFRRESRTPVQTSESQRQQFSSSNLKSSQTMRHDGVARVA
jgi:hypothetical protein